MHRIGIGRWGHSRRYENADLDITERFSSKFGVPYYRLYAVVDGESYFLMERGERELLQLAKFIFIPYRLANSEHSQRAPGGRSMTTSVW